MITIYESKDIVEELEKKPDDSPKVKDKPLTKPATSNPGGLFSPFADKFLNELGKEITLNEENDQMVRVSEALGGLVYIYERIRNVIEYKGEDVLRRASIERMIKRLLWERPRQDSKRVAEALIKELIWSRYLPNNKIPNIKINEVAQIIEKYKYLLSNIQKRKTVLSYSKLREWVWGIASCEIEEVVDSVSNEEYIKLMHSWFMLYFEWTDKDVSQHEKDIQIYLAVHRSFAKSDDAIMRYHLILKEIPEWKKAEDTTTEKFVEEFPKFYNEIEKHLTHPERLPLFRAVQKQVAPFLIFKEFIEREKDFKKILNDPPSFESHVYKLCETDYSKIRNKVNRGIVRSIIYIFITKVLIVILLEAPYELFRFQSLKFVPLAINISVPPLMMALIGLTIRVPGEENTRRIFNKLKTIVYLNEEIRKQNFSLKKTVRSARSSLVFSAVYLLLFGLVFGGISYILIQIDFTLLAILVFFMFVSLVLLFGSRVRFTASQLSVTPEREGLIKQVVDNLSLPLLSTGVYLSKGLAKLNFLGIILDFLIEAPLKIIVEVIEEWTSYVREKREEVVEVPEE